MTREVLKHPSVERVTVVDIDKDVIAVAKEYFADSTAAAFENESVDIRCMDAAVYVREHKDEFDVIIVDSADPVGPAQALFSQEFYGNLRGALRPGGIVCAQGESQWLHLDLIHETLCMAKKFFEHVEYASMYVPTYPSGQIGMIVVSNAQFVRALLNRRLTTWMATLHRLHFPGVGLAFWLFVYSYWQHIGSVSRSAGCQRR